MLKPLDNLQIRLCVVYALQVESVTIRREQRGKHRQHGTVDAPLNPPPPPPPVTGTTRIVMTSARKTDKP